MPIVHDIGPFDFRPVARVYTDGGVIGPNPSERGGTWAFCYVDASDLMIQGWGGRVTPAEVGLPTITNNLTELLAMLFAYEALPDGWKGDVYTDSLITLRRFSAGATAFEGIPDDLVTRVVQQRTRIWQAKLTLLAGHPTRKHLAAGLKNGYPVSKHNEWCNKRCNSEKATPV